MRFEDNTLRSILQKMCTPGGAKLLSDEWSALESTCISKDSLDTEQFLEKTADWYQTCYLWSIVCMISYTRTKMSALKSKKILFYSQAADHITNSYIELKASGATSPAVPVETRQLFTQLLQVPSLNTTKRLAGVACFHIGMRIRLTTTVLPAWAVQDSTGSVTEIDIHHSDFARLQDAAANISESHLHYQPAAIYV